MIQHQTLSEFSFGGKFRVNNSDKSPVILPKQNVMVQLNFLIKYKSRLMNKYVFELCLNV